MNRPRHPDAGNMKCVACGTQIKPNDDYHHCINCEREWCESHQTTWGRQGRSKCHKCHGSTTDWWTTDAADSVGFKTPIRSQVKARRPKP